MILDLFFWLTTLVKVQFAGAIIKVQNDILSFLLKPHINASFSISTLNAHQVNPRETNGDSNSFEIISNYREIL